MDLRPKPAYEDFEVHTEWVHEAADDTLIAYLPGFSKDQLKVQVTSKGNLRISGERPIGDNNKFSRFTKEEPIPSNCDQNKIRANYKGGMLHVKFPKLIVPADEKPEKAKPSPENPITKSDQRAADVPEQAIKKGPPKGKEVDKVPEQTPGKQKEIEDNSKSNASNESDPRMMEKDKNGSDQEEKSGSRSEKPADSAQYAARKADMYWLLGIHYERVIGGLATAIKNPRKVMNMVLAVLLVVVLAVYVKSAIVSMRNY
ncbi:hypothetical protein HRI_002898700 [Hibiscus trionum]|uniref:SHSP domain-containing protein n=1 Tax=Hibiscus trionum TaxID=183268 RepID=A0A9W7I871_HIBTR|nr:hypothetical protein HRI_002898700 [Hibiscus trionum]